MSTLSLSQYGISPKTGFLPETLPLEDLPPYFEPWEAIVADLSTSIQNGTLRSKIDNMPHLSAGKLSSVEEYRRAYSILAFMAHAYVWSPPKTSDRLPEQLSAPLLQTSEHLGVPPLATFASLCLWNFKSSSADWQLENLESIVTYTGAYDETWFYIVSVELEKLGGPCLLHGLNAINSAHEDNPHGMIEALNLLATDILKLTDVMMRLYENLSPDFFYNTLRPYLAGWKGMEDNGLPDGVYYGSETTARKYSGGSNGQSSLIQALDILLNVEHHATGQRQPQSQSQPPHTQPNCPVSHPAADKPRCPMSQGSKDSKNGFLMDMRNYMPREHREFLFKLESYSNTREYVLLRSPTVPQLGEAYDQCLKNLREFRSKHIQVVMRYISLRSKQPTQGIGLAQSAGDVGTGGTQLMPFLKQTRDEVSDSATGKWAQSLVTNAKSSLKRD